MGGGEGVGILERKGVFPVGGGGGRGEGKRNGGSHDSCEACRHAHDV